MMTGKDLKHLGRKQEESGAACTPSVIGLNDNLEFMGRQLHVQTEHMDLPMARIVTQVFCGGRVMLSKKTEYPANLRDSHDYGEIQQLMNAQHYQVLREISAKQVRILSSR